MKNAKDRRNNSLLEPDWFDGQMLWVMLRHLRADRRHRVSCMRCLEYNAASGFIRVLFWCFGGVN